MIYTIFRNIMFQCDPEKVHNWTLKNLKKITGTPIERVFKKNLPTKTTNCMGISFKNPLGLAAGLDKNGDYINTLELLGFGFIEIGTVTPEPQIGNEKPRIFYLKKARALINRMGFPNLGIDYVIEKIKRSKFGGVLGINISKNNNTTIENAIKDYIICIEKSYAYVNYIVINISSPNTLGLRELYSVDLVNDTLQTIKTKQSELQKKYGTYVPILIKISPDIKDSELIEYAQSFVQNKVDGVIAVNTTTNRDLVKGLENSSQIGGLSGRPLQLRSNEIIKKLSSVLNRKIPIIGVGGIDSLISAREKLASGASLIQIYSGLIFRGPKVIKEIVSDI